MNRTPFALLSAALLFALPLPGQAQQGPAPQGGARAPTTRPPAVQPGQRLAPISLQGRYLAARVGEQDHDYDAAADQMAQALALTPLEADEARGGCALESESGSGAAPPLAVLVVADIFSY